MFQPMALQNAFSLVIFTLSLSHYVASNGTMMDELEGIWTEVAVAKLRYYPDICMEKLRKIRVTIADALPEIGA